MLESKGVLTIAPFGKGNDVRDHMTLMHTLRDEEWACFRSHSPLRESCLHVLTWTSFRFSKHTWSEGDSSTFLRAFDEGVKGGDFKKGFPLGRDIPRMVKFDHRPHLDHVQDLERARADNVDPSIMRLSLVDTFRRYLDTDPWPPSDKA